jgi:hypothetical protein
MSDNGLFDMPDFDLPNFDFDVDFLEANGGRYINPHTRGSLHVKSHHVKYDNAEKLARDIEIGQGSVSHALLSGNFIAGDFIEALFVEKNIHTKCLSISTLSLSDENIDSLKNLLVGGFVDNLDFIISDYFHGHEKHKAGLVPYMLDTLDIDNCFQLAVAASHTKIALFETDEGFKFVIHGSANLRSSACVEQITIEENPVLYDFYKSYHDAILAEYSIIKKSLLRNQLWQAIQVQENGQEKINTETLQQERGEAKRTKKSRKQSILK